LKTILKNLAEPFLIFADNLFNSFLHSRHNSYFFLQQKLK